jgi:glycosyltransferase involved in cell wall biosynthesis
MRILYADSGLRGLEGHHASSGVALPRVFRELGHEVTVLGHRDIVPELQRSTGAQPFFAAFTYGGPSADPIAGWLTNFSAALEMTMADLHRAWRSYGPFDLVYFNSVKPAQVAALGLWLKSAFAVAGAAPPVVVELGTESGLRRGENAFEVGDPTAILYRHAVDLVGKPWLGRIAFVAAAEAAAEEYGFLFRQPVGVAPMPQSLPPLRRRQPADGPTVGLLGHQRPDKGYRLAPVFIPQVLQRRARVRFLVHQSDPDAMADVTGQLQALAASEPRLELQLGPAIDDAWFALLDRCDVIALPYDPQRYAGSYSAIVGEALASGAPIVVPAATTLAAELKQVGRPGVTIECWDADAIARAIVSAIDDFPALAERACRAGEAWHGRHGPQRFAVHVLEAADRLGPARPARRRFGLFRGRR